MPDLHYKPKRKNKLPECILTAAAAVACCSVVLLMFHIPRELIWECLFILSAVTMVFISTRYILKSYLYTLNYDEKVILITEKQGKKLTVLCRMPFYTLTSVTPADPDTERPRNRAQYYRFCVTMRPKSTVMLTFEGSGVFSKVEIEAEGEFLEALRAVADLPKDEKDREREAPYEGLDL